jgi:hypothetical protein
MSTVKVLNIEMEDLSGSKYRTNCIEQIRLEKLTVAVLVNKFSVFMETEISKLCSQKAANGLYVAYTGPVQCNSRLIQYPF